MNASFVCVRSVDTYIRTLILYLSLNKNGFESLLHKFYDGYRALVNNFSFPCTRLDHDQRRIQWNVTRCTEHPTEFENIGAPYAKITQF